MKKLNFNDEIYLKIVWLNRNNFNLKLNPSRKLKENFKRF